MVMSNGAPIIILNMVHVFFYLCRKLADKKSVRIIVYRNGKCTEPVEVLAELHKMQEVCLYSFIS